MGVETSYPTMLYDGIKVHVTGCLNCGRVIYWNTGVPGWLHQDTGDRKCTFLAEPRPR